ncbi:hypothetical protein C8F04DRAFT_1280984 [Mycena alexandri]|uniref:Uncharacterized protein n=1 Tax=Mycena alexandri TaxID=1745969 RepID=A0AAD6WMD5_9AGAR|nr:hypothetical protein C8F04DRAFT_1280984 [Mycena alexandri]
MDRFYDKINASVKLEELASARRNALKARNSKCTVHLADIELQDVDVRMLVQGKKTWRLCVPDEEGDVNDEVVVRMQGILTKNNLVPRNVQTCAPNRAQFLTQHVEVCGLDTSTFTDSMARLESIKERFAQQLAGLEVAPMVEPTEVDKFVASNRVFSLKTDVPCEQDNFFEDGVDSAGLLHKLKRSELIHAPENIVKYFRKKTVDEMNIVYAPFYPGGFQIGDLVELQVSFVAISVNKSIVKITTRLQAVTLLDNKFSQEASIARAVAALRQTNVAMRRKVGYFAEDEEEDRKFKKQRTAKR